VGDDDRAIAAYEEALVLARELSSWGFVGTILANLGFVMLRQGNDARAAMLFGDSLAVARERAYEDVMSWILAGLAGVMAAQSRPQRAARLLAAVEAWNVLNDLPLEPTNRADYEQIVGAVHDQLDETTFALAWAEGQTMTLEQAIAYALEGSDADSVSSIAAPQ
jgi:hypothetical protein